jgi:tetratricopeptide (TPR) repeat protein
MERRDSFMTRCLLRACVGAVMLSALAVSVNAEPPEMEILPMPHEDGVTCPYLRQQSLDRHAVQFADPDIGHDVLDNLARLKEADELLELAEVLANDGCLDEAMACCERAEELCPGSPCAERAADTKLELALGIVRPASGKEETAEPAQDAESSDFEDIDQGGAEMVNGLMKACHLFMSQGMHHQAAELARQAFVLDPERVQADPLIYKMHLLAVTPPSSGASEEAEPPTCPYCGNSGKPIRAIVAEPKESKRQSTTLLVPPLPKVDSEVVPALERVLTAEEASESGWGLPPVEIGSDAEGGLRLSGECSVGGGVYHLRYRHGCLAIWKTTDASQKP